MTWREILRELKVFTMRDLQDYRLADYYHLSAISRRILLMIIMPMIVVLLFFLWRYFLGAELLERHVVQNQSLEKRVESVSDEITLYQNFLSDESIRMFYFQNESDQEDLLFSETTLIEQVEHLLKQQELTLLTIIPKRKTLMVDESHAAKSIRFRKGYSLKSGYLIEQLQPLSSDIKARQLDGLKEDISDEVLISKLEIDLSVCGKTFHVLAFLKDLEKSLLKKKTLFYLEQLEVIENQEGSCLAHQYELQLYFYDLASVRGAYQKRPEQKGGQYISLKFPKSIAQSQDYLAQLVASRSFKDPSFLHKDLSLSMQQLFQEKSPEDITSLKIVEPKELNFKRWNIGETYQEMILTGIVFRNSDSFAIVQMKKGQWKTLQLGELNIIEIKPNYLILDSRQQDR